MSQYLGVAARVPTPATGVGESPANIERGRPSSPVRRAPAMLCRLAQCALTALRGRATVDGRFYRLDGAIATLADLVVAAREAGSVLPYPGIHPHATAFHTGPSAAPSSRARRKAAKADAN